MSPLRSLITLLLAVLCLQAAPLAARDQDRLEEWQERILRTLERQRTDRDEGARNGAQRSESLVEPQSSDPGAGVAAARAQAQHGGRVLAVARSRAGYRVRLLLEDGRVTTVTIVD